MDMGRESANNKLSTVLKVKMEIGKRSENVVKRALQVKQVDEE